MTKYIVFVVSMLFIGLIFPLLKKKLDGKEEKPALSNYFNRRKFLFDVASELNFYKILMELYGNNYRIFAQVQYSHLVEPKKSLSFVESRKYRNMIDRKSADFVICDKDTIAPILVIELDGSVHSQAKVRINDEFKNEITKVVDLPLLRINSENIDKEYIKNKIDSIISSRLN